MDSPDSGNFEFSDFAEFGDWVEHSGYPQNNGYAANEVNYDYGGSSSHHVAPARAGKIGTIRDNNREIKDRVAFKTKTEVEVLDDGFKWRKYGKKMVKNSPNPRNYYKCSVEGCPVKKRVERDREDKGIVITTYEGIHNHEGPNKF